MLNISKLQQLFLGSLASITLLLLGLAILGISLFSANRRQAAKINQLSPGFFNLTQPLTSP